MDIKKILEKENSTIEELFDCIEQVKKNGDVMVIKLDGMRVDKQYTVFITFPIEKKKEMIRYDEDNLRKAIINTLTFYVKVI
ncbi:hypothetical protein N6B72_21665 [Chryseobacterium soli]|uniref:hypothetical protein n=1 Tax=Chryseobacterium TaxID=59732 RepID=UPI002954677F|nr:hypothetical protein [Chryseobacterium soli]MDV7699528.1 hypothetical protein [Chryseobacterium soli]